MNNKVFKHYDLLPGDIVIKRVPDGVEIPGGELRDYQFVVIEKTLDYVVKFCTYARGRTQIETYDWSERISFGQTLKHELPDTWTVIRDGIVIRESIWTNQMKK